MTKELQLILDQVLVGRYTYACGKPICSDAEYDILNKQLKSEGINLDPIYENDEVPYDSFSRLYGVDRKTVDETYGITSKTEETSLFSEEPDLDFLNESASLSIMSVTSFGEAFNWFQAHKDLELIISTKIDGINTRRGYRSCNGQLCYNASLTRGRKSDPINITANMKKISPDKIPTEISEDLIFYSETTVPASFIDVVNEQYNCDYTVPRGLAMAMMRVADRFSLEDYKFLHSYVFRVDYGDKLSEGLEIAKSLGFETVPYVFYTYRGEPFEEFKDQMEKIIRTLKTTTDDMDVITDGMVAEVNDRKYYGCASVSNGYSSANIALKIGLWQPGVYESEVVALDLSQQTERCSCVAIVKPVVASGGQTITRVNCFNPAILFSRNILPGNKIRFEYKNETTVNLIY